MMFSTSLKVRGCHEAAQQPRGHTQCLHPALVGVSVGVQVDRAHEIVSENDEFCIRNAEFCIKMMIY